MANNLKREYPIDGLEQDVVSKYGRKIYCYISNIKGIKTFAKNKINRRFRRFNKDIKNFID